MYAILIPLAMSACTLDSRTVDQQTAAGMVAVSSLEAPSSGDPVDAQGSGYLSFARPASREYDVRQQLKITSHGPGSPSKQNLWIALIPHVFPYQEVTRREITPGTYQLFIDEFGNEIAEFDFSGIPPGSELTVQIDYRVKVYQLEHDLSRCQGTLPGFFTEPELHIESQNPQIQQLSAQLSRGEQTACGRVRAFYDYIGEELVYSYNGGNWGAQAALGTMGADCTEYASLMIALSRAAGIPARYIEGLSYTPEGKESLARQEHAWLEVYLPGIGWAPMDPTLGRSSLTQEQYFARMPADHIIVSRGRNPSALRGGSYWTHLYWPGSSTDIEIAQEDWEITPLVE